MIFTRPFRKPFWIISSFFKKHKRLILITTSVGAFLFFFVKNLVPFIPQPKPHLKIGIVGQYTLQTLPLNISRLLSKGLTQANEAGEITPDMAQSWEILEDETVYRLFLQPNLFWRDNTPVISSDINLNISDVDITYPDDLTIQFKLKEPFSPFLSVLSQPILKKDTIGAGQYLIKKSKYKNNYLKELKLLGLHNNITYHFYPSQESAWTGFKLGEVDQLKNLLTNPLDEKWSDKVKLEESTSYNQYIAVLFNLNNEKLTIKSLRQALAYALENKNPDSSRALTPINPQSWAFNSKVKAYDYNPQSAQELFAKVKEEASISGKLELSLGTSQSFLDLAESIKQSWEKTLDIKVNIKIINSIQDDFQALLIAQKIPLDPDQHGLWHSTQSTNITHYSNLKVDKLLEDGRKISDQEKRQEIYQDFQKTLLEDSPAIFLMHPKTYTIERK